MVQRYKTHIVVCVVPPVYVDFGGVRVAVVGVCVRYAADSTSEVDLACKRDNMHKQMGQYEIATAAERSGRQAEHEEQARARPHLPCTTT